MSDEPDDLALLHAWYDGDDGAAELLLQRHFDTLYRFFRSKLDGPIDDLIQSTLLVCIEQRDRFRGDAPFRVFLLGIARNKLLRHLRDRYRAERVFAPAQTSVRDVVPAVSASVGAKLGRGQERELLLHALRMLPLDLQIAVELRYWEELPLAEIARITETIPGTVKSRLARARQMLERNMAALSAGDADWVRQTLTGLERWADALRRDLDADGRSGQPSGSNSSQATSTSATASEKKPS